MQTKDALIRVAKECAEDLAADGIVYAEERFAPELHLEGGLTLDEVVDAAQEGFRLGCAGTQLTMGTLVTAMRRAAHSTEIAELAVRHRDNRSEEHTSELQSLMRISYDVFCLKKKTRQKANT